MLKLSKDKIDNAEKYIKANCRPLESARFDLIFKNGPAEQVIKELKMFQNSDGGFGHVLEPDSLVPDSSALATSLAFQIMDEIPTPDEEMIKSAIKYLEATFNPDFQGWYIMPKEVNNYPHAIWWNWDKEKEEKSVKEWWGNPSAELIGYLSKYKQLVTTLNVDDLIERAIAYIESRDKFTDEHEIYCYIRLYKHLSPEQGKRFEPKLIEATKSLVALDLEKWKDYSPQPLHFADNPNFFLYEAVKDGIEANLDYMVNNMTENGIWEPNWTWRQFDEFWPKQKVQWEGILTIQNLKILYAYDRVEK